MSNLIDSNASNHGQKLSQVETFFDGYAKDFDSIYSAEVAKGPWRKFIDQKYRSSMRERYRLTLNSLNNSMINNILDVGCGPGRYLFELASSGKRVTALDIAEGMLSLAKENLEKGKIPSSNITFVEGAYLDTNLAQNAPYDAAILMGFFDYTPDPIAVVKKLKKDVSGFFVGSFPDNRGPLAWQRKLRYSLRKCPLYLYSKQDVENILREAGITKYEITHLNREFFVKAYTV